jgi:hypothetical protein
MWLYVQTWLPLLTIALTAAVCFSVSSFIIGQARPLAYAYGIHPKKIYSKRFLRNGKPFFFGADPQFSCCERQGAASGLQEWQIYRAGYQAIELPLKG